ncbi:hypothetical protein Q1695_002030 [Nippostrongylus brasiliensis]|nr:hypothetical protein Q1695_002030 [Nippostrongylus brasiliensis]
MPSSFQRLDVRTIDSTCTESTFQQRIPPRTPRSAAALNLHHLRGRNISSFITSREAAQISDWQLPNADEAMRKIPVCTVVAGLEVQFTPFTRQLRHTRRVRAADSVDEVAKTSRRGLRQV